MEIIWGIVIALSGFAFGLAVGYWHATGIVRELAKIARFLSKNSPEPFSRIFRDFP
ncbi:MAG: hypothetical protein NZ930_08470 [Candidatus Bipolaricaulota bacterium]|nr:hypothetical protein [Candidatus Bipolaricaulota bacterium]MDW8031895.1 hypothetical protein [Candidatus Bipolaricaulota bacterium]MDW8329300.1 hypothetical protein [Candidatus Bipolaricaulota bacterium]